MSFLELSLNPEIGLMCIGLQGERSPKIEPSGNFLKALSAEDFFFLLLEKIGHFSSSERS